MPEGLDILGALSQPLRALVDPQERIFWGFLLSSLAMPWLLLGLRRGTLALRDGLLRRAIWASPSSRADITLVFVKALLFGLLRVPWLAATAGATLWVALRLHDVLGPAEPSAMGPAAVAVAYSVTLFVVWDASRFVLHLLMHRVRFLWAFHQVHHSATVLTPLTLYRTHPVETMLYDLRGLLTTAAVGGAFLYAFAGRAEAIEILGISALGFVFNLVGANLRHSHVWLPFGRVERWVLSPAQHQLHHARWQPGDATTNLGTWLSVWDRLAGTWRASPPQAPEQFGVDGANHRYDGVASILIGPLLDVLGWQRRRAGTVFALAGLGLLPSVAHAEPSEPAPSDPLIEGAPPTADSLPVDPAPPVPTATPSEPVTEEEPVASERAPTKPDAADEPLPSEQAPTESVAPPPSEPQAEPDERTIHVGSLFDGDELPRVAGSAHAIGERELERHEYDDVHKVLAAVPGVYVRGEDGFGLRPNIGLRGANPDRSAKITLLEDGVLLGPAPYSAPAAYYFPLTTRMVGMEVFKGPASIRHGPNTIGGAVNLRTREIPEDHMAEVDLAGGRFGYAKGHAYYGTTYRGFGVLVEAARVQTTGFKELDGGGDTGFAKNDAMIKLGYRTPSGQRNSHDIQLKGGFATERSNETYLGLSRADFAATPYRRYAASARDNMKWWRSQAELTYVFRQDDTIEFEARVYRHDFDRVWQRLDSFRGGPSLTEILAQPEGGQAAVFHSILRGEQDSVLPQQALLLTNNDRAFVSQGIQTAFRWRPKWDRVQQELEVGVRVHGDAIRRRHSEDAFLMQSGTMVAEGSERVATVRNEGETIAAAFHLYDVVTLWDRLTLAPGVRIEAIGMRFADDLGGLRNRRVDPAVSPGFGALVMATDWLGVFGGVHRGFSPVAPGQLQEIEPERSLNYELGARAARRGLSAEAVGFLSDYRNLIGACTFSAGCVEGDGSEQFNAGSVYVYGLETLARYRHRFDNGFRIEVGGRYTYTGSRFRRSFSSSFPQWGEVAEGDELPYVPEHLAGGTVGVGGRIWDVAVSPSYSGAMRDVAGQGPIPSAERVDGFFTLDVSAEVRLLSRFKLYTQLANVTNNAYVTSFRPFGIRPGPPLTFMLGIKAAIFP